MHLLKWVHFKEDALGQNAELRYLRDSDGREVDFVVTDNGRPVLLVECKWAGDAVSKHLLYLKSKFPGAAVWQIHAVGNKDYQTPEGIRVALALKLLKDLV